MATSRNVSGRLNRKIQYDILSEIVSVNESSNLDLQESYQRKLDNLPDADCFVENNPSTDILEDAVVAIEYGLTYDNQEIDVTVYSDGENMGVEVEGNGKSEDFISDFRDAVYTEASEATINGNKFSIKGFLSN